MPIRRANSSTLVLLLLLLFSLPAVAQNTAKPHIGFGNALLSVTNVTPGGRVMIFGAGKITFDYAPRIFHWSQVVTDDARSGTVTLPVANGFPYQSMWAAVDLTNGQYEIASPAGAKAEIVPVEKGHLGRGHGATVQQFGIPSRVLDLLYVSPAGEVLTWQDRDGSATDVDGANGVVTIALANGKAADANAHRPPEFAPGGLLIGFDWWRMRVYVARVDERMIAGAQ